MNTDWRQRLPVLRGDGLTLRELAPPDAAALTPAFKDADVGRYLPPPPADIAAFERFVAWARAQRETGDYFCYAVVSDADPQPVGLFQVHEITPPFKTAEWGFVFARHVWGTGIFDRSATRLLDYVFGTLGVRRLEARAVVDNARANGVLRRLGAVEEGRLRSSFQMDGQSHDDVLWSILDTDWAALRDARIAPYPEPRIPNPESRTANPESLIPNP